MAQSYSTIINALNQFADNHLSVKRFKTSFFDQFNTFSSNDNTFPILYAVPNDVSMDEYIDRYSIRIYCVDILQKDRSNEAAILNDTLWVLRDLRNWLNISDNNLNILNNPRAIPVNNFLTEFTVGWYLDFEIEANAESNDCSIPFSPNFIFSGYTCDFTYVQQYLTCDTLDACQTIIDINNAIDASIVNGSYDNPSGTLNLIRNDGGIIPVTGFTQSQASTKTLLAGGAEWSGVGMIFDVSELTYTFTGEILFAGPTSVTLLSGDPTNPRIDAIVVDEAGNITVIEGTPSPDPATPAIPEDQLLVQYVIVAAGATTPNITQEFIYLENTEWTTTTYQTSGTIFGSVNLASTTPPPFEGLVCINSNTDPRTGIRFTRVSPIDISQYSLLTLRVWIDTPLATNKSLQASILLSGVAQGVTVNLNTLGFNRNLTGQWQQIIIPVAAFGAVSNIDRLQLRLVGGTNNVAVQYALDYIQLQTGIAPPSFTNEIIVERNGTSIASRPRINFIEGINTSILAVDDIINDRVNITIASTGATSTAFTGGTISGATIFTDGLSANTFSATTYLGLPLDIFVTGGTYSAGTTVFTNNSGGTFSVSGFSTGVTTPDTYVTGFTYNNSNVLTIKQNQGQSDLNALFHTVTGLTTDFFNFNTGATVTGAVGRMTWNDTDGTLDLGLKGGNVTLQIGQEQVARVVNKTSPLIDLLEANYQVVVIAGATGQRLSVRLAKGDNDANSAGTLGVVTETILRNQEGFITTGGQVRKINTTGSLQGETWNDGDILYLSPTTFGAITNIKPVAPQHSVTVGYVEYAHAINGKIFVKVDNGYELGELHNVLVTGATNGQVLTYSAATGLWIPTTTSVTSGATVGSFGITIDGMGGVISTGQQGYVSIPYNATINGWTLLADQVGSCVIDVWRDTFGTFPPTSGDTIAGNERPTLTSQNANRDLALTGWTTSITSGDIIGFNVLSATGVTRANLIINVTKL